MAQLASRRDVPLNLFTLARPLRSEVLQNRRLTPPDLPPSNDVRHLVLASEGLRYLPGQSIGVLPEGVDPRTGKPHKLRLYSVCSPACGDDGGGRTVSIVVVRHFWSNDLYRPVPVPGVCSRYLCDFEPGQHAQITGPAGKRFLLPEDVLDRDLVFVATGTGVAPFRAMLAELAAAGYTRDVWLFFGAQFGSMLLYDDEFRSRADLPNFHYAPAVSREGEKNPFGDDLPTPGGKMYVHVRMWQHREALAELLARPGTVVYVCGLKGMEAGVTDVLDRVGRLIAPGREGEPLSQQLKSEDRLLTEVY